MKKTTNWQLIQKNKYYSTTELADVYGYQRSAIKYWFTIVLKPVNPDERRFLFYGEDIIKFFKEKKIMYKVKLKQDECYCAPCKKRRRIAPSTLAVEFTDIIFGKGKVKQVIIRGEYAKCGYKVVRLSSTARIDDSLKYFPSFKRDNGKNQTAPAIR